VDDAGAPLYRVLIDYGTSQRVAEFFAAWQSQRSTSDINCNGKVINASTLRLTSS